MILSIPKIAALAPFALSKKRRQDYIEIVEARANYLADSIGEETGKHLGPIVAKDAKHLSMDIRADARTNLSFLEQCALEGIILHERAKDFVLDDATFFKYRRGTIYTVFGFATKSLLLSEGSHPACLDSMLLHELGHRLWERLWGNPAPEIWQEGFATYCSMDWFSHLAEGKPFTTVSPLYHSGRALITRMVEQHGKCVLFDIPRNWEAYEDS